MQVYPCVCACMYVYARVIVRHVCMIMRSLHTAASYTYPRTTNPITRALTYTYLCTVVLAMHLERFAGEDVRVTELRLWNPQDFDLTEFHATGDVVQSEGECTWYLVGYMVCECR
jgi:hypothetical protein